MSAIDRIPSYDPAEMARHVADHAYNQRFVKDQRFSGKDDERYGVDLHIESREDLARHIEATLRDPNTFFFEAVNSRDIYYNKETNTAVVINNLRPDRSTCIRGDLDEKGEIRRLFEQEIGACRKLGLDPPSVFKGGYDALETLRSERANDAERSSSISEPVPERVEPAVAPVPVEQASEQQIAPRPAELDQDPALNPAASTKNEAEESQKGEMTEGKAARAAVVGEFGEASQLTGTREINDWWNHDPAHEIDGGMDR